MSRPDTTKSELAVKQWRARERAWMALVPILEREHVESIGPGELSNAAIDAYEAALKEPLPDGWGKVINR